MMQSLVQLPLDVTGRNPNNLISGEEHTPDPVLPLKIFTLYHGGFYANTLKVYNADYEPLTPNVDYVVSYKFENASRYTSNDIGGAFIVINDALTGPFISQAQMVGGDLAFSMTVIDDYIAFYNQQPAGYIPRWMDYYGNEPIWGPGELAEARWHLDTYQPFNNEIDRIARAVNGAITDTEEIFRNRVINDYNEFLERFNDRLDRHIDDKNNPHVDTRDSVGLSRLENYPVATPAQAIGGVSNTSYMTPFLAYLALEENALKPLQEHIDTQGPIHGETAAVIGAPVRAVVDATLNAKYDDDETVVNSNNGQHKGQKLTYNQILSDYRLNIPADNFASGGSNGFVVPARLGRGSPSANHTLMSNGQWVTWEYLFAQYGSTVQGGQVRVMVVGNMSPAAAHQLAISQPYAIDMPIGSMILYKLTDKHTWGTGNGATETSTSNVYGSYKTPSGWVRL